MQLFAEQAKSEWNHTALLAHYVCEVNRDPKRGKKLKPEDFNPWTAKESKASNRLTADNIRLLKRMLK